MRGRRRALNGLAALSAGVLAARAHARAALAGEREGAELTLIVPMPPGAGNDAVARLIVKSLGERSGFRTVVANFPGGNHVIAASRLLQFPDPDGAVMLASTNLLTFVPALLPGLLRFEPEHELIPLATVSSQTVILVATTGFDAARIFGRGPSPAAAPIPVRIGSVGSASVMHFYSRMLGSRIRQSLDVIPYRGMADLSRAVLSGEIDIAMVDEISVRKLVASGRARAIATMSSQPAVLFPEVPLWRDFGFGALDINLMLVVFAGRRMSEATKSRLATMLQALSRSPDFHEGVSRLGFVPMVHTGADAGRIVANRVARERQLLRESGSWPVSMPSRPSDDSPRLMLQSSSSGA